MSWRLENVTEPGFYRPLEKETWFRKLSDCPQDPIYHAEGNVGIHVRMVCDRLVELPAFRELEAEQQQILAWAALLHDVAKPRCTKPGADGRLSSPGHAVKGSIMARRILWERACPFEIREQICGLVNYHMACFWALEREQPERLVREISQRCSCHHLGILAEADARGRECPDLPSLLDKVELFREQAKDSRCYDSKAKFASETARFQYFHGKWHDPNSAPFEEFRCQVIVLSGLPGSGKDTWIKKEAPERPVISLDALRAELKISPRDHQGRIIDAARERAREYLRSKQDFIWNATNISLRIRRKCLSLFLEYGAKVHIVYLEEALETLEIRNFQRDEIVPWPAILKMLDQWEVPTNKEAHQVSYFAN